MSNTDPMLNASDFIWGAKEIARFIGRSEKATFGMLESGKVPGVRKVAGRWALSVKVFAAAFEGAGK